MKTIAIFNNDGTYTAYPSIEEFVKANQQEIEDLLKVNFRKARYDLQKVTIKELNEEVDELTAENKSLKEKINEFHTRIKGYEKDMEEMERALKAAQEQDIEEEDVDCPWKSIIVMDWFKDIFEKENPTAIEIEMEDDDENEGCSLYIRKVRF